MARLAITGLISNLDTDSIINGLLEVQRGSARLLEQKRVIENNRLIALQNLNARMLSVSMAVNSLTSARTFQTVKAASSNSSILTAHASNVASAGTHIIEVQALAKAQSFAGGTFSSRTESLGFEGQFMMDGRVISVESTDSLITIATTINNKVSSVQANVLETEPGQYRIVMTRRESGEGLVGLFAGDGSSILQDLGFTTASTTLGHPITQGAASGRFTSATTAIGTLLGLKSPAASGSVTLDDGSGAIQVQINLETDSLQQIADAINAEAGLQGSSLSASVEEITIGWQTYQRLEITGTGSLNFTDDNNVLQTLEILRPELVEELQAGQNSRMVVNGVTVSREGNLVADVIAGVTLVLNSAEVGRQVTLSLTPDYSTMIASVQNFVDNYNNARSFIREQTSFNSETLQAGALLGDSAVLSVERNMFDIIGTRVANVLLRDLSELNNGAGADSGRIRITDRSGASVEIDLSSARSVQDIINAINAQQDISVTARANANGSGILLEDTSRGTGTFEVSDVGSSTTAADLGIAFSGRTHTIYGAAVTNAGFVSLVDIGISSASNGALSLDQGKLNQMLTDNPRMVERLFTATQSGVAHVASQKLEFITRATGGTISNRTKGIQSIIEDIDKRLVVAGRRLSQAEERLQKQFAALEQALAAFQSQNEFLTNQLYNLGNIFNRNSRR